MTGEEIILLKRKWLYQKCRAFGNVMAGFDGMKILDFTKDGTLITKNGESEFSYTLHERNIEISNPLNSRNAIRMRICELTKEKLVIAISGKKGDEKDDRFRQESIELEYAPTNDT